MTQLMMIAADFWTTITEKFIIPVAALFLAIFGPVAVFYHCIIVFILLNFVSGLTDDLKRGEKFSWTKFKTFMLRILFYVLTITMVYLFERFIISEMIGTTTKYLTAFATGLISLYEIRSFLVNAGRITGNPVFQKIFDKINSYFKKKANQQEDQTNEKSDNYS
jgi:phage-related holin